MMHGVEVAITYSNGLSECVKTPATISNGEMIMAIDVRSEEIEFCGTIQMVQEQALVLVKSKPVQPPVNIISDEEQVKEICSAFGLLELIEGIWNDDILDYTPEQLILTRQVQSCITTRQLNGLQKTCMILKECMRNKQKKDGIITAQIDLLLQFYKSQSETSENPSTEVISYLQSYNLQT